MKTIGRHVEDRFNAGRMALRVFAVVFACFGGASVSYAQLLSDYFTNRVTVTNLSGEITQSLSNATVEAGEPLHGGKPGGHSLWISWIAATNGIVTFKTDHSGFDTLISAYQFTNSGTTFAGLREVARSDDAEGLDYESSIEFGVHAGQRFEIAVDGYRGDSGRIDFQWEFRILTNPPPLITSTLADRAVNLGNTLALSFAVTNSGSATYKWERNGSEIDGISSTNLVISNFPASKVGRYRMRVIITGGVSYYSVPVEIQVNTDGSTDTLAQPKFRDSPATPLIGSDGGGGSNLRMLSLVAGGSGGPLNIGVVRGYNGSQIFSTTYAVTDTNEPAHCNVPGGASYWLLYQPPTNGTVTLDTLGSSYDTVMEVYTYNSTPTNYTDLIKIDCSDNAFPSNNASRVVFSVVKTRQYLIAVDGVGGARGTAWLNYSLNTNQPAQAPSLTGTVAPIVAPIGATVAMHAPVTGTPPLMFTWRKNGVLIPGLNSSPLVIANVTTNSTASYSFTVTNDLGGPAQSAIGLTVISQPACSLTAAPGLPDALKLSFPTIAGRTYFVEDTTNLAGPWLPWPNFFVGDGQPINAYVLKVGNRFFRVRIE